MDSAYSASGLKPVLLARMRCVVLYLVNAMMTTTTVASTTSTKMMLSFSVCMYLYAFLCMCVCSSEPVWFPFASHVFCICNLAVFSVNNPHILQLIVLCLEQECMGGDRHLK